jgi:hypothetical protein
MDSSDRAAPDVSSLDSVYQLSPTPAERGVVEAPRRSATQGSATKKSKSAKLFSAQSASTLIP